MIEETTIHQAIQSYLDNVSLARSENTARTYRNALSAFRITLEDHKLIPEKTLAVNLPEDAVAWFASDLKSFAPTTERLYLTAVTGFFEYLAAERLANPNLPRLRMLIRQRARRPGQRLPQFPKSDIEILINYAINIVKSLTTIEDSDDGNERLRHLRDRAFLITLADTGLRVHEACKLRRGDIDWDEGKAIIIGKGNKQAVVRFSSRSLKTLKEYLNARAPLDGASRRPLTSLPIFARHDRGAGKKVKSISTRTGQNIIAERVREALGEEAVGTITPHSFRHYFVTNVLSASGNLKLAQKLARHTNIAVTERYAHLADDELDQSYWEIFEENER